MLCGMICPCYEVGRAAKAQDQGARLLFGCSRRAFSTYICPIDPETSVHTLSISSLSLSSAKACRVGSGSDKKPTRPAADVRAGIAVAVCCLSPSLAIHAVASDGCEMGGDGECCYG